MDERKRGETIIMSVSRRRIRSTSDEQEKLLNLEGGVGVLYMDEKDKTGTMSSSSEKKSRRLGDRFQTSLKCFSLLGIFFVLLAYFYGGLLFNYAKGLNMNKSFAINQGLVPEVRASLYISLDKPVYRPGDTLYMRTTMLDSLRNRPFPFCISTDAAETKPVKPVLEHDMNKNDKAKQWDAFHTDKNRNWYQYELHAHDFNVELIDNLGSKTTIRSNVFFENCVHSLSYSLPKLLPGGIYTIRIGPRGYKNKETFKHLNPAWSERTFEVRTTTKTNPKLRMQLEFEKEGYYAGETVHVRLKHVIRADGKLAHNAKLSIVATAGRDREIWREDSMVCNEYPCSVWFKLDLEDDERKAMVNVVVTDGAVVESTSKSIPMISDDLEIEVFPESGVLVSGLQTRVYIQARDKNTKKPLDVQGEIIRLGIEEHVEVGTFKTYHEGRGLSTFFLVEPNARYSIQVSGRTVSQIPIPEELYDDYDHTVNPAHQQYLGRGAVLTVVQPVVAFEELVVVQATIGKRNDEDKGLLETILNMAIRSKYDIALFKKDHEIMRLSAITLNQNLDGTIPDENEYALPYPNHCNISGVLRVTLFDHASQRPLAERLIFRKPEYRLQIGIGAVSTAVNQHENEIGGKQGKLATIPSATVGLQIYTWKKHLSSGKSTPVEAFVSLAVVDDALVSTVDERELPPDLTVAALLEHEVDQVFSAHDYLPQFHSDLDLKQGNEVDDASTDLKLDLLLGTQGWRRFIFYSVDEDADGTGGDSIGTDSELSDDELGRRERVYGYHPIKIVEIDPNEPQIMPEFARGPILERGGPVMMMNMMAAQRADPHPMDLKFKEAPNMEMEASEVDGVVDDMIMDDDEGGYVNEDAAHQKEVAGAGGVDELRIVPAAFRQKKVHTYRIDRVYAHKNKNAGQKDNSKVIRDDFKETVLWNPSIRTKIESFDSASATDQSQTATAKSGTILFDLSDSASTFKVFADGFTMDGTLGSATRSIVAEPSLTIDTVIPQCYVVGDKPLFPIMIQEGNISHKTSSHLAYVAVNVGRSGGFSISGLAKSKNKDVPYAYEKQIQELDFDVNGDESGLSSKQKPAFAATVKVYENKNDIRFYVTGEAVALTGGSLMKLHAEMLAKPMEIDDNDGEISMSMQSYYSDTVAREYVVLPNGFPISIPLGAMIEVANVEDIKMSQAAAVSNLGGSDIKPDNNTNTSSADIGANVSKQEASIKQVGDEQARSTSYSHTWVVKTSESVVKDTVQLHLRVHLRSTPSLIDAVKRLIREPCGCFEQTSSTTYPLLLVLEYLKSRRGTGNIEKNEALITESIEKLRKGYEKLASYESKEGGFEWFGGSPGHETLTAYGLIQFSSMKTHIPGLVDEEMIQRTQAWLMGRRDGEGQFKRNPKALDSFGRADMSTNNAYILWSLAKAGMLSWEDKYLVKEIDSLLEECKNTQYKNPYILALATSMLVDLVENAKNPATALPNYASYKLHILEFPKHLVKLQSKDGSFQDCEFQTITSSGGDSKQVEVTSLAVIAWLKVDEYDSKKSKDVVKQQYIEHAARAMEFISLQASGMFFGSTQATALALKAIIYYESVLMQGIPKSAKAVLKIDGEVVEEKSLNLNNKLSEEEIEIETDKTRCTGAQVWNECGSRCTPTCSKRQEMCVLMCVARCECPADKPYWDAHTSKCLDEQECEAKASEIHDSGDVVVFDSTLAIKKGRLDAPGKVSNITIELIDSDVDGGQDKSERNPKFRISGEFGYYSLIPPSSEKCMPELATKLTKMTLKEGEKTSLVVEVKNKDSKKGLYMVVAVIGVPAALEVNVETLKDLQSSGEISYWETTPGFVTLYWRGLKPTEHKELYLNMKAVSPGSFKGKASHVYEYYTSEEQHWIEGLEIEVLPNV